MIRRFGVSVSSYSQTPNWQKVMQNLIVCNNLFLRLVGRVLVSRTGEVGSTVCKDERLQIYAYADTGKVFLYNDSRSVAMEVGIRNGVCNNSATEWRSPENGRILSVRPLIHHI